MNLRWSRASDLAVMLRIFEDAFAEDDHTQLKLAWRGPASIRDSMASALEAWLVSPVASLLVVEDDAAGVMGWACWSTAGPETRRDVGIQDVLPGRSAVEELEAITRQEIERCRQEVLETYGTVDVLVSIVVDPVAQGRGVGGRLIRWGVQRADAAGRACWVHASDVGARAMVRHGFVVHRDLEIDLSPYAPPGQDPRSWGTVRFRSMIRPPRIPASRP